MNTEMKVTGLTIDPFTNMPVVILKDLQERNAVNIWIGLIEASAIATELEQIRLSRPMTHDLLCSILTTLGASLTGIEVRELRDNTFFAHLMLSKDGKSYEIDARPSDAIALALRMQAPIFVTDEVIEKSRDLTSPAGSVQEAERKLEEARWAEFLETLPTRDFGKYKM
jgi:hypothetical protein